MLYSIRSVLVLITISIKLMTLPVTKVMLMKFFALMNYLCFIKCPTGLGADNNFHYTDDFTGN